MPKIRGNTQILDGSVHGAQLEDSGVTAGTYGDDLNVAQITVDAKGRVTDVVEVAITGGGGGGATVATSAYRGTNQTLTHATEAAISMSATSFDTDTMWSAGAPTRLTVQTDGKYQVNSQIKLGTGFAGVGHLRIYVNGSLVAGNSFVGADVASGTERHSVTWIGNLVSGDYIEFKVQLDLAVGSGTFDVVGGSDSTFIQALGGVAGTSVDAAFNPDTPPTSANAMDDEFRGGSLDPKWTALDQQVGQTITVAQDHVTLISPSTIQRRMFGITQPAPAGNYRFRCKFKLESASWNYFGLGMIARRGTKGLWGGFLFQSAYGAGLTGVLARTSDVNTFVNDVDLYNIYAYSGYLELEYDGTNLIWRTSQSGADASYCLMVSEAVASFLGGAPDTIGIVMHPYGDLNTNMGLVGSFDWFRRLA